MHPRRQSGFTLVELLIVVLIMGLLATIAIPVFNGQRAKARASAAMSAVRSNIETARSIYYSNNETYPAATLKTLFTAEEKAYTYHNSAEFGGVIAMLAQTPSASANPKDVYLVGNSLNNYIGICTMSREEAFCAVDGTNGAGTTPFTLYGRSKVDMTEAYTNAGDKW